MIMYCRWSLLRGVSGTPGFAAAVVLAWGAFATTEAFAQQETVVIGGSGLPEVEVNLDVLDRLGPAAPVSTPEGPTITTPEPPGKVEKSALEPTPAVEETAAKAPPDAKKAAEPVTPPARPSMTATVVPVDLPPAPPPKPALTITPPPTMPTAEAVDSPAPDEAVAAVPTPAPSPPVVAAPADTGSTPEAESSQVATADAEPAPSANSAAAPVDPGPSESLEPAFPLPEPSAGSNGEAEAEVAALSPDSSDAAVNSDSPLLIVFVGDSTRLPEDSQNDLKGYAQQLLKSDALRVQVMAYAGGSTISASAARRLSLSRALAVRAFLIERGVRSTRIDVRALGNKSDDGPSERVDVVLVNR